MFSFMPCGGLTAATAALTRSATATVFSPDWRLTDNPTAVFSVADVFQLDEPSVAIGDHHAVERLGRLVLALGLDNVFHPAVLDPAARNFLVLGAQCPLHVIRRERGSLHLLLVEPDTHLPLPAAA